jgi:hypothetical protein
VQSNFQNLNFPWQPLSVILNARVVENGNPDYTKDSEEIRVLGKDNDYPSPEDVAMR